MFESVADLELAAVESGEEILFLEPRETFDRAIVGLTQRAGSTLTVVAYDRDKCIEAMMQDNDWDYEDAVEFFEFNTAGAWVGDGTPIFIEGVTRE